MSLIKIDQVKALEKANAERITELKQLLRDTDYVTLSDYDKDKTDIITQRQVWREEIRKLQE
jgi:hypothetical protein